MRHAKTGGSRPWVGRLFLPLPHFKINLKWVTQQPCRGAEAGTEADGERRTRAGKSDKAEDKADA